MPRPNIIAQLLTEINGYALRPTPIFTQWSSWEHDLAMKSILDPICVVTTGAGAHLGDWPTAPTHSDSTGDTADTAAATAAANSTGTSDIRITELGWHHLSPHRA